MSNDFMSRVAPSAPRHSTRLPSAPCRESTLSGQLDRPLNWQVGQDTPGCLDPAPESARGELSQVIDRRVGLTGRHETHGHTTDHARPRPIWRTTSSRPAYRVV